MPHRPKRVQPHATGQAEIAVLRHRLAAPSKRRACLVRLVELLYGGDAVASLLACELLGSHGGPDAIVALVETVLWSDPEGGPFQRELRVTALAGLRELAPDDNMVVSTFLAATRDPDPDIAWPAAAALGECQHNARRAMRALTCCLTHPDLRVRGAARASLQRLAPARAA